MTCSTSLFCGFEVPLLSCASAMICGDLVCSTASCVGWKVFLCNPEYKEMANKHRLGCSIRSSGRQQSDLEVRND